MGNLVKQLGNIDKRLKKNEITELAVSNAQAIIDSGKYDLLKVYVELKRYESYLQGLISSIKKPALEKASKERKKTFNYDDATINISKRTKWNFSIDRKWVELDQKIITLLKEKKEREQYLKDSNKVNIFLDKDTGEIIENFELPQEIEYGLTIRL